ncbi:hypothetical protein F5883DRAFT_556387 [Diaporthe sp. PMI_573]|nr:hypothetical protein F5883DRAFT_556387 [Diaporthaceae sp. PMI_573]
MVQSPQLTLLSLLALSPLSALARTDLSGCTTFTSTVTIDPTAHEYGNVFQSLVYYDPDTLEICTVPDCGGGRAAPKTGVPGCPLYSGTATPTPSFLSADPLAPSTTSSVVAETTGATAAFTGFSGSESGTVPTVATAPGLVNATGTSGSTQATGDSTNAEGSSTGAAAGTPSSSVNSSSGDMLRVTMGGLSVVLALAAGFVM